MADLFWGLKPSNFGQELGLAVLSVWVPGSAADLVFGCTPSVNPLKTKRISLAAPDCG